MGYGSIKIYAVSRFKRRVRKLLNQEEHAKLLHYLIADPEAGLVIPGAGGLRKLRWCTSGSGKRGGVRVIYYYLNGNVPIMLLDIYKKNQQRDIAKVDLVKLKVLVKEIAKEYGV